MLTLFLLKGEIQHQATSFQAAYPSHVTSLDNLKVINILISRHFWTFYIVGEKLATQENMKLDVIFNLTLF